jgi:hypothetical protein
MEFRFACVWGPGGDLGTDTGKGLVVWSGLVWSANVSVFFLLDCTMGNF